MYQLLLLFLTNTSSDRSDGRNQILHDEQRFSMDLLEYERASLPVFSFIDAIDDECIDDDNLIDQYDVCHARNSRVGRDD